MRRTFVRLVGRHVRVAGNHRAPQGKPCTGHAQGRCGRCEPNGCAGIFLPQYTVFNGNTRPGTACLDLDGDGQGHCCRVIKTEYDIKQGGTIIGFCFRTDCENGTAITPFEDCSNPYRAGIDSEDRCYANNNPNSTPQ